MADVWETLRRGEEVVVICEGTEVRVKRGKTGKDAVLDVTWPNGKPTVIISDYGFDDDTKDGITKEEFEKILIELPSILSQAETIRNG